MGRDAHANVETQLPVDGLERNVNWRELTLPALAEEEGSQRRDVPDLQEKPRGPGHKTLLLLSLRCMTRSSLART